MLTERKLIEILNRLRAMEGETEVVEFKWAQNSFSDEDLGQYFSALSNEANLKAVEYSWLVFGVDNKTHDVLGSNYKSTRPSLDAMKKKIADQTTNRITFEEIYAFKYNGHRIVMFQIPAAPLGLPIAYKGHYYGRDGESLVALNLQEIERIRNQGRVTDWSKEIIAGATINDLDPKAIAKAREKFAEKYPKLADEAAGWSDATFLDKAKITIKGKITNAAIILLGKEESEVLISPAVATIRWILKDHNGQERDYQIFHCPLILSIDAALGKIRNLKYRYINPELKTLFPDEVDTYEPYVIREALNNSVAHSDYRLGGQINIVEFEDKLVFSNKGGFIPGSIENVLKDDSPEENYRNFFLATAMVNLKMVDTIGSGIKKMYTKQRERLFPLPVYEISNDRVVVTITGKIIDINYSNLLARNKQLSLVDIELLNRVQFGQKLSSEAVSYLRKKGLIEGRKPNIYISKNLATTLGKKVEYSKHRGLDENKCNTLITSALKEHGTLTKAEITSLLGDVLSDILDEDKKYAKVGYLLKKLRQQDIIDYSGKGATSKWFLKKDIG